MLRITISGQEFFNEVDNSFTTVGDVDLELEHSLISLSKWESEFEKPFLIPGAKSTEEILGYIRAMILTVDYPLGVISRLDPNDISIINSYIDSKQSATTFGQMPQRKGSREVITAELIYYWMVTFNIPFECETWHLNRLFSLIRICNVKNSKPKKMSRSERADMLAQRQALNAQRKAELGTNG